jgi:hypothetical protein
MRAALKKMISTESLVVKLSNSLKTAGIEGRSERSICKVSTLTSLEAADTNGASSFRRR